MLDTIYLTKASLTGSKASVIRMLNAAIKNVGDGKVITPEDSIETINARFHFNDEDGHETWLHLLFHDFLDMESIDNDAIKQRQRDFTDWCEKEGIAYNNYDYHIIVKYIIDKGDEYEVELRLGDEVVDEEYNYLQDWAEWADLAKVYGAKIYVDVYHYDTVPEFYGTKIYELVDGTLKTTEIKPSYDLNKFFDNFYKLIELNPQRYKLVMIETLENEIGQLQYIIRKEKLSLIKDNLKENGGHAEIPEGWKEIDDYEFRDWKELKSITFPSSLKTIGAYAFSGCENLREITIPSSVESVGYCAFKDCPCAEGMDEKYWKESIEDDEAWINSILG